MQHILHHCMIVNDYVSKLTNVSELNWLDLHFKMVDTKNKKKSQLISQQKLSIGNFLAS